MSIKFTYGLITAALWFVLSAVSLIIFMVLVTVLNISFFDFLNRSMGFVVASEVILLITLIVSTHITSQKLRSNDLFKDDTQKILITNTISFGVPFMFLLLLDGVDKVGTILTFIFAIVGYYLFCSYFVTRKAL